MTVTLYKLFIMYITIKHIHNFNISGWLHDRLGSYGPGFYLAGGAISLSGIMLFLIPLIERRNNRSQWNHDTALEQI